MPVYWSLLPAIAAADDDPLAEARFSIKKHYWTDAQDWLDRYTSTPDGRIDPEAWYLLAQVRYELLDLEAAKQAAERAHSYSRNDQELEQASSYAAFLRDNFGVLRLRAAHEGLAGPVKVDLAVPLLDPNLDAWFDRQKKKLAARQVLPIEFGLPTGSYRINGHDVTVGSGAPTEVELTDADVAGHAALLQLSRVELGAGLGSWFGDRTSNLLPSPRAQLSVLQPVGPVVVGVVVTGGARWFTDVDGVTHTSWQEIGAGVSVGVDVHGPKFLLRPAVGYRYSTLPGIELHCAHDGDGYSCGDAAATELVVYGVGRAHVPFLETSLDWVDIKDQRTLGLGLHIAVEEAIGALPSHGTALDPLGSTASYDVLDDARPFFATGARLGLHLMLAF
jgi:hypothetical protein